MHSTENGHDIDIQKGVCLSFVPWLFPANGMQACSVCSTSSCSEQLVQTILVMCLFQSADLTFNLKAQYHIYTCTLVTARIVQL